MSVKSLPMADWLACWSWHPCTLFWWSPGLTGCFWELSRWICEMKKFPWRRNVTASVGGLKNGHICKNRMGKKLDPRDITRVPDQNGVSQAWYIVEIHHSGREPSISGNAEEEEIEWTEKCFACSAFECMGSYGIWLFWGCEVYLRHLCCVIWYCMWQGYGELASVFS